MSTEGSTGQALGAYVNPFRTNRRRTFTGGTLVSLVVVNEVPLDTLEPLHHHPVLHIAVLVSAGILGADYLLEGLVRLKRWPTGKVVIIDLGKRDHDRQD